VVTRSKFHILGFVHFRSVLEGLSSDYLMQNYPQITQI